MQGVCNRGDSCAKPAPSSDIVAVHMSRLAASAAEAELHGEVFLVILKPGYVAVFPYDPAMDDSERQMRSGVARGGQGKVLDACFNPWLGDDRQPNNDGEKRKVFENRQREVGLLSRRLAGEGDCFDVEEECVGKSLFTIF